MDEHSLFDLVDLPVYEDMLSYSHLRTVTVFRASNATRVHLNSRCAGVTTRLETLPITAIWEKLCHRCAKAFPRYAAIACASHLAERSSVACAYLDRSPGVLIPAVTAALSALEQAFTFPELSEHVKTAQRELEPLRVSTVQRFLPLQHVNATHHLLRSIATYAPPAFPSPLLASTAYEDPFETLVKAVCSVGEINDALAEFENQVVTMIGAGPTQFSQLPPHITGPYSPAAVFHQWQTQASVQALALLEHVQGQFASLSGVAFRPVNVTLTIAKTSAQLRHEIQNTYFPYTVTLTRGSFIHAELPLASAGALRELAPEAVTVSSPDSHFNQVLTAATQSMLPFFTQVVQACEDALSP